jgi:hypothetical protein
MKTGDVIVWNGPEEDLKGLVTNVNDRVVTFQTLEGQCDVPLKGNVFHVVNDSKFKSLIADHINRKEESTMSTKGKKTTGKKTAAKKVAKKVAKKTNDGPSKMDRCVEWRQKHPDASRQECLAAYQDIGCTVAGSATYYSLVDNKIKKLAKQK